MRSLATGSSAFATFVQVVPRLATLLRHLGPTWHLSSLAALDGTFVEAHGIRGLIWDVDGTLTGDRGQLLTKTTPAFHALLARPGLKHVVLSNSGEERFKQLGDIFPTVPLVRGYLLGKSVLYRRRLGATDSWSAAELEQRLAEGARMLRKPSAELVDYAIRELGCGKDEAVMVGDQYFTDVAGANLAGVRSIKLPTMAKETFRISVRISQFVESLVYAVLYGRAA
ncbi:MAG: HAD hydrolase-like protein [Gemmatimonadales bacterium]